MAVNTEPDIHQLIVCANIFVRKDEKYLLLKRSPEKKWAPGFVHPIGGKVDLGEDPFVAAEREVLEEAGIKVKNVRLEAVFTEKQPVPNRSENWLIFHFSGDYDSGDVVETEEGELVYLTAEEIMSQKLFPSVKEAIHHILNPNDGTVFLSVEYDKEGNLIPESKVINVCAV